MTRVDSAQEVDALRLVGPSGTNKVMTGELIRLAKRAGLFTRDLKPKKDGLGSLILPFSAELAVLCARYHRTCSRVLWDLYASTAPRLEPLYDDMLKLASEDSRALFVPGGTLSVSIRGSDHFAAGGRQVVGTIKNALIDGLATRGIAVTVDGDNPDVQVMVRVTPERLTVSLDLGGPMNQRGYRGSGAVAPLRENLAATLLMLARHDPRGEILVDPMAGTGTLAIEAAGLARGAAIRVQDRVAAGARVPALAKAFSTAAPDLFADTRACIVSNELDELRASLMVEHVERAGVSDQVECRQGDFRNLTFDQVAEVGAARGLPTDRGLIICNPPYGERLEPADLGDLYSDLGKYCRTFRGFRAGVFVANPDFEYAFGGEPRIKKPLSNAQLRAYFLLYDL